MATKYTCPECSSHRVSLMSHDFDSFEDSMMECLSCGVSLTLKEFNPEEDFDLDDDEDDIQDEKDDLWPEENEDYD